MTSGKPPSLRGWWGPLTRRTNCRMRGLGFIVPPPDLPGGDRGWRWNPLPMAKESGLDPTCCNKSSLLSSGIYKLKLKIILPALRFLCASTETRAAKSINKNKHFFCKGWHLFGELGNGSTSCRAGPQTPQGQSSLVGNQGITSGY